MNTEKIEQPALSLRLAALVRAGCELSGIWFLRTEKVVELPVFGTIDKCVEFLQGAGEDWLARLIGVSEHYHALTPCHLNAICSATLGRGPEWDVKVKRLGAGHGRLPFRWMTYYSKEVGLSF